MRGWVGVIQNKAHFSPGRAGVGAWTDLGNILGLLTSMPGSLSFEQIFLNKWTYAKLWNKYVFKDSAI